MKISNKKKFIVRIIEAVTSVATIIVTLISIDYATKIRGYVAIGGEYLIPIFGLLIILFLEEYLGNEEKKNENRKSNKRRN